MTYLMWLLRIVHIVGGVIWVGGTLIMTFFIAPAVGATAEAGQKFLGHLMGNLKFSNRMSAAAGLTVLAGATMYWIDSDGLTSGWILTRIGLGFGTGAIFALIGFVFGVLIGRTNTAMAQLGSRMHAPPSAEQIAQMKDLQRKLALHSRISAAALIIAVILMSIARYLSF